MTTRNLSASVLFMGIFLFVVTSVLSQNNSTKVKTGLNDIFSLNLPEPISYPDRAAVVTEISYFTTKKDSLFIKKDAYFEVKTVLNEKGGKLKQSLIRTGDSDYWYLYSYDLNGNISSTLDEYRISGSTMKSSCSYKYDNKGNKTEKSSTDGTATLFINKFNSKGKITEAREINKQDSVLVSKLIWLYDATGNMIKESKYDQNNELEHEYTLKYDVKGNILNCIYSIQSKFINETKSYKYDLKGNIIEESLYSFDPSLNISQFTADSKYTYKYDKNGNVIEKIHHANKDILLINVITKYFYEFDNHGNWIKKTEIENDDFGIITERNIAYYEYTPGTFTDNRDGKVYKTTKIGTQTWMAENLAFKADTSCWTYNNDTNNIAKYGYLYNWEIANKVCPLGWHLPDNTEWATLTTYLGKDAGQKLREDAYVSMDIIYMSSTINEVGFTARFGGIKSDNFSGLNYYSYWWTSQEKNTTNAYEKTLGNLGSKFMDEDVNKSFGLSVRCLKD